MSHRDTFRSIVYRVTGHAYKHNKAAKRSNIKIDKRPVQVTYKPVRIKTLRLRVYGLPDRVDKSTIFGENEVFNCSFDTPVAAYPNLSCAKYNSNVYSENRLTPNLSSLFIAFSLAASAKKKHRSSDSTRSMRSRKNHKLALAIYNPSDNYHDNHKTKESTTFIFKHIF